MVVIFLGSKTDLDIGLMIGKELIKFAIPYTIQIASAHKTPDFLLSLINRFESDYESLVYITVAGRSNALGGFVDAQVVHPVINCPPYSEKYAGLDLLSSLRMPSGIAVLTILEPEQAALAAAKILGISNKQMKERVKAYQKKVKDKLIHDNKELQITRK